MNSPPASSNPLVWKVRGREIDLSRRGLVMGIVNVTPDSFSDGGQFLDPSKAIDHALALEAEGADILDIGGESTRPGAADVPEAEERARILPVIEQLASAKNPETLLSIDTLKPGVARDAVAAGADIINDVSGLRDPAMREVAAGNKAGLVLMHMQGTPRTMQSDPQYEDVVEDVRAFFREQLAQCEQAGIDPARVCFDPGIGFGKTLEHNLTLLRRLRELRVGDRPLLLGVSRKSFLGKILGTDDPADRSWPTVALTAFARENGAEIFRVHEVRPNREALGMAEAIRFGYSES